VGTLPRKANRLIYETSPYLLQHAYNPVDWYPWGEEALAKAKRENKPILLSIGYSACHWCHVMERESFANERIARIMNEHFVNIKVDREERPDLDHIYQTAVQLLTGHGGWPLTVFLTPDQRPFYAGTYFPPEDRFGRPGLPRVLLSLIRTWREDPERIERAARQLTAALRQVDRRELDVRAPIAPEEGDALLAKAAAWLLRQADEEHGGFGSAPKFPNASALQFLLRVGARRLDQGEKALAFATFTLTQMARGGIYDQLGGGFHRYAVDEAWRVPHFEKMLYDNALLPPLYIEAYQLTGDRRYAEVARHTLTYVLREMSHPGGGFYSSQDADSEGEEGKYFVWRPDQIAAAVGEEEAALVCAHFGVTERGNFEGQTTVLRVARGIDELAREFGAAPADIARRLAAAKERLLAARERRAKPGLDDKVITGWNALMISALARAAEGLGDGTYLARAREAAGFIMEHLTAGDRLLRSFRIKPSPVQGYLEDYAYWVAALIDLYEATLERGYLEAARHWMDVTLELFYDADSPGFFLVPQDQEGLIHRPKDWRDQSTPSGTGVAVQNLLRLHPAFDRAGYEEKAAAVLETYRRQMDQNPWGTASLLLAYDGAVFGATELVLVARPDQRDELASFAEVIGSRYIPQRIVHAVTPGEAASQEAPALWQGKEQREGRVTAYVCRNFRCSEPVVEPEALAPLLESALTS